MSDKRTGRPPLPADQQRVVVAIRLKHDTVARLKKANGYTWRQVAAGMIEFDADTLPPS